MTKENFQDQNHKSCIVELLLILKLLLTPPKEPVNQGKPEIAFSKVIKQSYHRETSIAQYDNIIL